MIVLKELAAIPKLLCQQGVGERVSFVLESKNIREILQITE
jgi:hypothetical protein